MARTVFQQDHGLSAYRWVVAEAGKYRHAQPGESPEGFVVSVGGPSRFVVETAGEVKLPTGVLAAGSVYTVGTDGALVASSSGGYGEATGATAMKLTPTVSSASSGGGSTTIVTVPDRFPNFYTEVSIGTLTLDNASAGPVYYHIPTSGTAPTLEGNQIWTGTNDFTTTMRVVGGAAIDGTAAPAFSDQTTLSGGTVEAGTDVSTGGVLRVHGTTDVISMGSGAYGAPIVIYYDPATQTHGSALSWSYGGYQIGEIGYDTTVVGGTPVFRITTEANQPSGAPSKDIEVCPGSIRQIVSRNTSISMLGPVYVGSASTTPARTLDVGGTFRASGNSTIGGTFGVTGATTLSSTLAVTDTATFSNSANVTGAVTATAQIVGGTSSSTGIGVWSMGIARFSGTTTSSAPSVWANGPWYTGAMPLAVFGDFTTGTWSSDGTGVGINTPSTFTGNILDLQKNGASKLAVSTTLATVNVPLQMANATADPGTEGSIFWDPNDHTLAIRPDILGSTLQVGQEMWIRVVNKTGSLIPDGTAVYVNGAQGNRPTVTAAIATSTNADRTIGVVTSDIANNAEGLVTIIGTVHGYNTSSFTTGDVLYLSGTTAGALTNVRPTAPTHAVRVGYALNSTNNGSILVALHTGDALADLHDTVLTSPASTDILQYDGTVWRNVPIGTVTSLDTLSDVTITSPTPGQIVQYNGSQWVNAAPDSLTTLDALTDVTITSPTLHQSIWYDGSGWVNYSPTVSSLTDAVIISPSVNQFLRYNGSNWVNAGVAIPTDLDSLTDTTITSPTTGQVLRYDGSVWRNYTAISSAMLPVTSASTLATARSQLGPYSDVYITATSGTTARTLADRAADDRTIRDQGAVADGATDDTTAIAAAISLDKSVRFVGAVKASAINLAGNKLNGQSTSLDTTGEFITIQDTSEFSRIVDADITATTDTAVHQNHTSYDVLVSGSRILSDSYAVLSNSSAHSADGFLLIGSYVTSTTADAVEFNHPSSDSYNYTVLGSVLSAENGSSSPSAGFAVGVAGTQGVIAVANHVRYARTEAFHFEDTQDRGVCGFNTVQNAKHVGIRVSNDATGSPVSHGIVAIGNHLVQGTKDSSTGYGFYTVNDSNGTLSWNSVIGNHFRNFGVGLNLDGTSWQIVDGNVVEDCDVGLFGGARQFGTTGLSNTATLATGQPGAIFGKLVSSTIPTTILSATSSNYPRPYCRGFCYPWNPNLTTGTADYVVCAAPFMLRGSILLTAGYGTSGIVISAEIVITGGTLSVLSSSVDGAGAIVFDGLFISSGNLIARFSQPSAITLSGTVDFDGYYVV